MQPGQPSRTARAAAAHRAAHQILEQGRIFRDPLALRILGEEADAVVREAEAQPARRRMRFFIALRTRFAEDALAAAVERGAGQLVVLGAGLDTFAYRNPFAERLRVFEVDHPMTQAWKRRRLAEAGIAVPASLTFTPVDFERDTLADGLASAGFDRNTPAFFTWLGVVPYLTRDAMWATLAYIAGLPGGAQVVFDYSDPPHTLGAEEREIHDRGAAKVAALGEAWVNYLDSATLPAELRAAGFAEVEDLGPKEIAARFSPGRGTAARERGGHVLRASTFAKPM
jgi:methyltransferase (TIGR00027 family)